MKQPVVLAVAAHPDDVELMMSGTLSLLRRAGAEIHIWTLANGCCGTNRLPAREIARIMGGNDDEVAREHARRLIETAERTMSGISKA